MDPTHYVTMRVPKVIYAGRWPVEKVVKPTIPGTLNFSNQGDPADAIDPTKPTNLSDAIDLTDPSDASDTTETA
jgi:hypothetical protein